ncbi:LamG-like jellyroll fold domain-containing protein [Streptantibioticus silvisoli]|uniref:LamG-like jellyroll fold domain-containing protein n=1 Tax=Streptantibioticus silvisoli TaxID=2705255 RepID=A0ABT6W2E1_9ACTN|nr:LamG-like jellyroll fold domain-containing protein [Streptantibioticus silvisoli]MDI5964913.1 hypothetical protein [Streptantibioticus silvisoli]
MRQRLRIRSRGSDPRRRRKAAVLVTAALLIGPALPALSLGAASAAAADTDPGAGPTPTHNTVNDVAPPGTSTLPDPAAEQMSAADRAAIDSARSKAARTGKTVAVTALTTDTSTVSVAPSGHVTYESSVLPVRVRRGKDWVPVDTTLTSSPGGGYTPAATPTPVVFSGGGRMPLATMAGPKRTSLALTWPTALPKPFRSGATLTYPSVLPSVDLVVSATDEGGFHETLVVKTAAAARNAALATLKLGVRAHGIKVSDDGHGNLNATTPDGDLVFHAPAPEMWDSSTKPATAAADAPGTRKPADLRAAAPATASTATAPGSAARVAAIRVRAAKGEISLAPDRTLLTSKSEVFPLYAGPTWTALWKTGYKQHFDEVQQGCPSAQNFDSTAYGDPGVGDNAYSGCLGVERAFYQLGIPSTIYGGAVEKATFNLRESYSASCSISSTVDLYLSAVIHSSTDWSPNQPGHSHSPVKSQSIGPACTSQPSTGFDLTTTVRQAATDRWSNLTLGVFNSSESNSLDFKRFATNPTLSIEYDHAPDQPSNRDAKVSGTDLGCATGSSGYPLVGKTDSVSPVTLSDRADDPDGDSTQTTYQYWISGSSTRTTVLSANGVASPGTAQGTIPGSFISGLTDGTTVDWQPTSVTDGEETTTAPTGTVCHFTVYPDTPTIKLTPQSATASPENTPVRITASSTDPNDVAVKYVYQLDTPPPTSNAPASETVSGSNVVNGTATITVTPPGPGIHTLNVIGYDSAGNASHANSVTLDVAGATGTSYPDFTTALNATGATSTGNTAISSDAATSLADADGGGHSLSAQDLEAAGWNPGGKVTLDGATFSLPDFGTSTPTQEVHDNILADNQTIGLGDASGDSLVMLAFGTWADYQAAKDVTGDSTLPHVAPGTDIVGSDCTMNNSTTAVNTDDCQPASGTVNYADSSVGTNGSEPYYLSTPDWNAVTNSTAVLALPHRNVSGSTQQTQAMYLYAFAVHLEPGKAVSSITLPDISGAAKGASNAAGAPVLGIPALHVVGIAVRDTTSAGSGRTWTGAWSGDPDDTYSYVGGAHWTNMTMRDAIVPSVSGSSVRIHLSNQQSNIPVTITHVTVADQKPVAASATTTAGGQTITTSGLSPIPQGTPVDATFGSGDSTSVTIPAGGDLYSNPISAGITVTAGSPLLVSTAVTDAAVLSGHSWGTDERQWITAAGAGDTTTDTTGTPYTASGSITGEGIDIVSGVDVTTTTEARTVAVLGDGIYHPDGSTADTPVYSSAGPRLSDTLTAALAGQTAVPDYGVVNAGIEDNSLIADSNYVHGKSVLSRLDRDIVSEPGLQTVVIEEGLTDVLSMGQQKPDTVEDSLVSAYVTLAGELNAWGIKVVFTTMTPCGGNADCTTGAETVRADLNGMMRGSWPTTTPGLLQTVDTEDADHAVSADPTASPEVLATAYDTGDHVNINPTGGATIGLPPAFQTASLTLSTIPLPLPPVTPQYRWLLDEGTGNISVDSSGNAMPLSLNGTTWGKDPALPTADASQKTANPDGIRPAFNGSTSYGQVDAPLIDPTQSYIVDVWVKLDSTGSADQWAVTENSDTQQALTLGYSGTTKKWTFAALDSNGSVTAISGPTATAGTWVHLTASYDQSVSTAYLDVNGVQAGTAALTPAAFAPDDSNDPGSLNDDVTIGAAATDGTTLTGQLTGAISDLNLSY